jgi:hypothetical protein
MMSGVLKEIVGKIQVCVDSVTISSSRISQMTREFDGM